MKRIFGLLLVAALAASAGSARPRPIRTNKVDKELKEKSGNGNQKIRVLVRYAGPIDGRADDALAQKGAVSKGRFNHVGISVLEIPANKIKELEDVPGIDLVTLDKPLKGSNDYTVNGTNTAATRTYGYLGQGVGVAVIDSGVNLVPDLRVAGSMASRVVYSQDFTGSGTTNDQYGHGTHVATIIAGNSTNSTGASAKRNMSGIAPMANIVNLKVLTSNGSGNDSWVIAAIDRAIELKSAHNIRVINLSLGRAPTSSSWQDPLCWAVERAHFAGISVVVSAGNQGRNNSAANQGYGMISTPGIDPYAITVGAVRSQLTNARSDDSVTTYSSKGPSLFDHYVKPDVLAPGNLAVAARAGSSYLEAQYPAIIMPTSYYLTNGTNAPGQYVRLSGTSMATPVVAGAVALMVNKTPSLTPDVIKARIMKTASKSLANAGTNLYSLTMTYFTIYNDIFTIGAGYLDTLAALNNTDTGAGEAFSPESYYDSTTGTIKLRYYPALDIWAAPAFSYTTVFGTANIGSTFALWKPVNAAWPHTCATGHILDTLAWILA